MRCTLAFFLLLGGLGVLRSEAGQAPPPSHEAEDRTNLLRLPAARLLPDHTSPVAQQNWSVWTDGKIRTSRTVTVRREEECEWVIAFKDGTVTPDRLVLQGVQADTDHPVTIEVLVSTLSPYAGFRSLRVCRPGAEKQQEFAFVARAARWIRIRIAPVADQGQIGLAEIALWGRPGPPRSRYRFKESPAKALDVVLQSKRLIEWSLPPDESALLDDAMDGRLDDWSFAEAALIASGVVDRERRRSFLEMIERLERRAQQAVADADTPFEQGERLLRFLHETVLQGGYRADQTRISELLEKHTYNCVSSATIYNILGTRLGLDLRAIEVPDHAFSILYDGAQHVDVEATSAEGFDPSRDPRVLERFRNQTGFRYIPDRHPDQRREITNLGLVSLIYYNRGVAWGRAKAFDKALVCYLCALQLDREFASAIKNALATLANWSIALADQHRFDRALKVVEVGLKLAPQDAALRHNRNVIWQKSIEAAIEQGRTDEALARARAAKKAIPDGIFDDLQAWVFVKPAEEAVEKFRLDEALQFVETGMRKVDDEAREKLELWVRGIFLRKARWHLERKEFAQSVAELEKGLTKFPDDKSMSRNLGFVALQWATNKTAEDGLEAGLTVLATLAKTHEGLEPLREAMHVWADRQATRLAKQGNYDQASQVYEKALDVFPGDAHLRQNCQVVWLQWAQSHMQARRWDKAASVLRQAAQRWPKGDSERNLAYLVQEWLKEAWEKQGLDGSARVAQKLLQRFPKTPIVRDAIRRHFLRQASRLVEQQEFQRALRVIERGDKVFGEKRTLRDGGRFVCDRWAGILQQRQQWREATEVYARGLARYPNDGHLKNNAVVTWNRWARTAIKKKDWKKAIAIYEEALKAFPSSALLKNNLRYCRQQAASRSRSVPSEP